MTLETFLIAAMIAFGILSCFIPNNNNNRNKKIKRSSDKHFRAAQHNIYRGIQWRTRFLEARK